MTLTSVLSFVVPISQDIKDGASLTAFATHLRALIGGLTFQELKEELDQGGEGRLEAFSTFSSHDPYVLGDELLADAGTQEDLHEDLIAFFTEGLGALESEWCYLEYATPLETETVSLLVVSSPIESDGEPFIGYWPLKMLAETSFWGRAMVEFCPSGAEEARAEFSARVRCVPDVFFDALGISPSVRNGCGFPIRREHILQVARISALIP